MNRELRKVKASDLVKLYEAFHPGDEFRSLSDEEIFDWGIEHGYDVTPDIDLKAAALKKIKRAIKQSVVIDAQGRKVPKYIFIGDEDGQLSLWAELAFTPSPIVQKNIDFHREKGIQTMVTAQIIADSYNDNYNLGEPITLDLFIADDVAEEVIIRRNAGQNPSDPDEMDDEN